MRQIDDAVKPGASGDDTALDPSGQAMKASSTAYLRPGHAPQLVLEQQHFASLGADRLSVAAGACKPARTLEGAFDIPCMRVDVRLSIMMHCRFEVHLMFDNDMCFGVAGPFVRFPST